MKSYSLKYGHKYWIVEDIDSILDFQLYKMQLSNCILYKNNPCNPFINLKIDDTSYTNVMREFLKDFYQRNLNSNQSLNSEFLTWGNIYQREKSKCTKFSLIPHIDSYQIYDGIVSNIWMNEDLGDSGTNLYHYHGNIIKTPYGYKFDFMVDTSHAKFNDYHELKCVSVSGYENFDWSDWGFEYLGIVPSQYKTMTIYKITTPHTAFIPNNVEYRFGCSYLYASYSPVLL